VCVLHLCGVCVASVWRVCCICVVCVLHLCGVCVASVWCVCCICVACVPSVWQHTNIAVLTCGWRMCVTCVTCVTTHLRSCIHKCVALLTCVTSVCFMCVTYVTSVPSVWHMWNMCVAVCCSVLQCVAVCCSVPSVWHGWYVWSVCQHTNIFVTSVWRAWQACCSVLQCVAVCCSVLQCVAVCWSHLCDVRDKRALCVACVTGVTTHLDIFRWHVCHICVPCVACAMIHLSRWVLQHCTEFASMLQYVAVCCSVLQCIVDGYCSTVRSLLDWFEVDLGFTELLCIQIDLCVMCVVVLHSRVSLSSCPFFGHPALPPPRGGSASRVSPQCCQSHDGMCDNTLLSHTWLATCVPCVIDHTKP